MSGESPPTTPVLDGPLPAIVCIGDSLTEFASQPNGWASHLQNHFVSRRDVLLRGMAGYNSRWLRRCLDKIVPGSATAGTNLAAITLLIGTNDAVNPDAPSGPGWPQQHVPLDEYEANLTAMVQHLLDVENSDGSRPFVIVMSPPPQDGEAWHKFMMSMIPDNTKADDECKQRSCDVVESYAKAARRVVDEINNAKQATNDGPAARTQKQRRLAFIDLYESMMADTEGWRRFLSDGVHLSADGNKFVFEQVSRALFGIEGSPDMLPRHAPHFFDVDAS